MKILATLIMPLFCIFQMFGQDIITCKTGQIIKCKVLSSDSIDIQYQFLSNFKEYKSSIPWDKVEKIVLENGYQVYRGRVIVEGPKNLYSNDFRSAISFGFLHGGGALIGADLELMVGKRTSIQFGGGLAAFGAGLNIHFRDNDLRSSFVSIQYWKQGFGNNFVQSLIGPNIVFRAKKIFTATLGAGYVLETGQQAIVEKKSVILTYAIGVYAPF